MSTLGKLNAWDADRITFADTSPKKILVIRGGESVTIKMTNTGSESVYLGPTDAVSPTQHSYKLDNGETASIGLSAEFGYDSYIEVWAVPETANDTLTYMKVTGVLPETEAT